MYLKLQDIKVGRFQLFMELNEYQLDKIVIEEKNEFKINVER